MAKNPQCDEFLERLNELLDCSLDPAEDPRVSEHARQCHSCRTNLNQYRQLEALTRLVFRDADHDCPGKTQIQKPDQFDGRTIHQPTGKSVSLSDRSASSADRNSLPTRPIRTILGTLAASVLILVVVERPISIHSESLNVATAIAPPLSEDTTTIDQIHQERRRFPSQFFSLSNCYEITSELPGIRPIRGSLDVTLHMLHQIVPVEFRLPSTNKPLGRGARDRADFQFV